MCLSIYLFEGTYVTDKIEIGSFRNFQFIEILFQTLISDIFNRKLIEINNSREKISDINIESSKNPDC